MTDHLGSWFNLSDQLGGGCPLKVCFFSSVLFWLLFFHSLRQYFAPSFRYVALNVDAHHAVLDSLLSRVSNAIRAVTDLCLEGDEPFQSVEFRRPKSLHVTTCYLGNGSTVSDAQRTVVAASKSWLSKVGSVSDSLLHLKLQLHNPHKRIT